jgi:predicted transcriptional regulator
MPDLSELPTKPLGPLEARVMEILWRHGEDSARGVREKLSGDPAYTTVMTTLDRLHAKGWANRRMVARAWQYTPRITRREWDMACAKRFIGEHLADPRHFDMLTLSLIDTASAVNPELLDELERRIAANRLEIGSQAPENLK